MMKRKNVLSGIVCALLTVGLLMGCSGGGGNEPTPEPSPTPAAELGWQYGDTVNVEITMEDGGVMVVELDHSVAPVTVENFVKLAEAGFYDGLIFHRIIPGFMVQGGDPMGTGMGGSEETITGEFAANGIENPISHERGVISMARKENDPNSASSQFFIVHQDSAFLDGGYAAFGRVVEGIDVVDEIAAVETDAGDRPVAPPVIKTIRVAK